VIIEHALLQVKPGMAEHFKAAMQKARPLIAAQSGFRSIEVRPTAEGDNQFLLLVGWDDIESHRDGFRKSSEYQQWRSLLHDFYDPMPTVSYFRASILDD